MSAQAEEDRALLADIAERQKALQSQVAAMAAEQARVFETYEKNDASYQERTAFYQSTEKEAKVTRTVAKWARFIALVMLAYIAYRVSR